MPICSACGIETESRYLDNRLLCPNCIQENVSLQIPQNEQHSTGMGDLDAWVDTVRHDDAGEPS